MLLLQQRPTTHDTDSIDSVNPLYYVTFTTFTLIASFILFRGFNTSDAVNTISLLCGFLTIFTGVYLLNLSREDPDGGHLGINSPESRRGLYREVDGIPTDPLGAIQTRMSMQSRRSSEDPRNPHRRSNSWSLRSPMTGKFAPPGDQQHLMHSYDVEAQGLSDLAEDSDEDSGQSGRKRTSFENEMGAKGYGSSAGQPPPRRSQTDLNQR